MNPRLISGLVLGASLLAGGVATSAPAIATFEGHNDMYGGALWRNDRPNNNDQRGAGAEHQKVVRVGDQILVVATASYTNITPLIPGKGLSSAEAGILPPADAGADGIGSQARGTRIQGLCTSYKIDPIAGLVKTNQSYFTNNDSDDWQNAHKMAAVAIDGGKAALINYGFDPPNDGQNRTQLYAKVLGPDCAILSPQELQFKDNDDDYGGAENLLTADAAGVSRVCGTFIGNGNGSDDGHSFCSTATNTGGAGAAAYSVKPNYEIITENDEERTRAQISTTPIANHILACWAQGNNQPTDNIRCGLINTAPGVPNEQRLVWRQRVATRNGNIQYGTPALAPILGADGLPSDKFMLSYVQVDTTNRNGRYKGRSKIFSLPIQIATTGLTKLDEPRTDLFGLTDGAHPGMTVGLYGVDKRPVAFLWSATVTDGGPGQVKIVGLSPESKLEPIRALNWAKGSSGAHSSLWYGNNPNTPQGRSYPVSSLLLDNAGYGVSGGFQPEVKTFLVAANVHPLAHSGPYNNCEVMPNADKGSENGRCGGKNAFSVALIPVAADPASTTGNPNDPNNETPTDPTDPDGEIDDNPGQTLSGCSTTGAGDFGALLILGLGLVLIRRRRA